MIRADSYRVSKRVRHMEDDMTDVIEKVDKALKKMETIEEQMRPEGETAGSRSASAKSSTSRAGSARSARSNTSRTASARSTTEPGAKKRHEVTRTHLLTTE